MKVTVKLLIQGLVLLVGLNALAVPQGKYFDRVITVVFENEDYSNVMTKPFFAQLANSGVSFSNFIAEAHPSQGNYIALTSGSLNGVTGDSVTNVSAQNIVDLLEAAGVTWKVYAEDYPGNCFLGVASGKYARKHNPFISYTNIQRNPARCAKIVNANELDNDYASGNLPSYIFYVPNMINDGHNSSVTVADSWYNGRFGKLVSDQKFMAGTILISTFDESSLTAPKNQIYTSIVGPMVKPGKFTQTVNHYSLLKLVEDNWSLGNLGKQDVNAPAITGIWQ